jgi:hypothetical protein
LKLADGQSVEEFVGDEEQRMGRQVLNAVCPDGPIAMQSLRLDRPQTGGGFDQNHPHRGMKTRHGFGCAQDIGHQRAATGAKFGQGERIGRALVKPRLCQT